MKKLTFLLLLTILLSGCGPEVTDYTLGTVPVTEVTTGSTTAVTEPKEYREYAIYPVEHPTDNVSGNRWYEKNVRVVTYYDTDLRRKVVLCSQPSCTHSSRDCTAFLGGSVSTVYVVRGDVAYALIYDFDKTGNITFVSQNLITGQRELIWDLTPEENVVRQRFQLSVDGNTAFLSFEQYTMVLQDLNYSYEDYRTYGYAIDLTTGKRELVVNSEITVLEYIQLGGGEFLVQGCTEQYLLVVENTFAFLPMTPSEYLEQNPTGDYDAYFQENPPQSNAEIVSINRVTGERTAICDYGEAHMVDMGVFRDKKMSFVRDNTMCVYDGRTGQVTEYFTKDGICKHRLADGRILYTLEEGDDDYSHWYYDPNTDEHHRYYQHIHGETRDCFRIYTDKGYRFISKQDWYNECYDRAF